MKRITILMITALLLFNSVQYTWATEKPAMEDVSKEDVSTEDISTESGSAEVDAPEGDPLVIVLDPGHDKTHGGAWGNGLGETALNLKIAQYCYEELRTYNNVRVYMTRYTSDCPYPEACGVSQGARKDNLKRVEFAASVGADAYVALHLNSVPRASVNGAIVFVPDYQYRYEVGKEGRELGASILKKLVALGLKDRGVDIRLSEDGTHYEDGSLADYYGVIKKAKDLNIPGIIVEHCFISSPSDCENFLSTDAQLKALGVADATGIAEYYGLTKGQTPIPTETFHTVKFMRDGKLISTQYVRDGYAARVLDEEELEITNITYSPSLGAAITGDAIIEITYDPLQKPEKEPQPTPDTEPESESEENREPDTETESEMETETGTDTEMDTETEHTSHEEQTDSSENEPQSVPSEEVLDRNNDINWGILVLLGIGCAGCIVLLVVLAIILKKDKNDTKTEV